MSITRNFSMDEFHCKDGTRVPSNLIPNVVRLATNLQVIRDHLNYLADQRKHLRLGTSDYPIHINSAYRTQSYNESVGGKSGSLHLEAKASDITHPLFTPVEVYGEILWLIEKKKITQGGAGLYNTFVHYDIRGTEARWRG